MPYKYQQLADKLREAIHSGRYAAGQRLPSERELREEHGLARMTIRQAMETLEREGLVRRMRGFGVVVVHTAGVETALKAILVKHVRECFDRRPPHKFAPWPDHSDIYANTIAAIKALYTGKAEPAEVMKEFFED